MNLTPQHLSFARLVELVEDRLTAEAQADAHTHLTGCPRCSTQFAHLAQTVGLMRADTSEAAPRDAVAYALNIFRPRAEAKQPSLLRRLVAALSFDSAQLNPAYGVRSGQSASAARQLLYSAGEKDIDLRIAQSGEKWVVSGQLLGECSGGRVELQGERSAAATYLNEQCEFALPAVPAGTYTLRLRLTDAEVEVPQLELRG